VVPEVRIAPGAAAGGATPLLVVAGTCVIESRESALWHGRALAEIGREVGLPPGVLNVVHGLGGKVGQALVRHPAVTTLSFTGGTRSGAAIAAEAAPLFKKLTLELGGKNPTVVFADADRDRAVAESVRAAFSNQGQICLCGSRLLVEEPLFDDFVDRFVAAARALRLGDPLEPGTEQGALVSRAHRDKVLSYIDLARKEGGQVLCGGGPAPAPNERCRDGFFVQPTVIAGLGPGCRVNQEEIFGPVVTIQPFRDEEEAVASANSTPYGLAASLWTSDLGRAHRLAERLEAGTVWVNCWMLRDLRVPFGGSRQSGVGREGGLEALRFFTEPKNVCLRLEPAPAAGGAR
jgi:aminomuconate-semialdehyde/2-hydroxymuconate-6-semialdehyde dehydrogenase